MDRNYLFETFLTVAVAACLVAAIMCLVIVLQEVSTQLHSIDTPVCYELPNVVSNDCVVCYDFGCWGECINICLPGEPIQERAPKSET